MKNYLAKLSLFLVVISFSFSEYAHAGWLSLFAKGSVWKEFIHADEYTVSIRASTGLAVKLFSGVRIEARYTNTVTEQNKLDLYGSGGYVGTIGNLKKNSDLYTVGLDIEFLGPKSSVQPYLFVGAGYLEMKQTGVFTDGTNSIALPVQTKIGVTGNMGLGIRIALAQSLAFEIEAFGSSSDLDSDSPLIDLYGNVGIRVFI